LGKTLTEINGLPAEEYESWKLYYQIEPFGWHDNEYRMGAILAMLNNVNASKKKDAKKESDYMRDMPKLIMRAYQNMSAEDKRRERLLKASIEERRQLIAQAFGTIVKEVKIGNSGNDMGGSQS
jgi:hypothetical protein